MHKVMCCDFLIVTARFYPYLPGLLPSQWSHPMTASVLGTWRIRLITFIMMTSHERHVVSNPWSFDCLFNSLCRTIWKEHQSPHYWPFVTPHKGPVTRKRLPFDDVIMNSPGADNMTITKRTKSKPCCTLWYILYIDSSIITKNDLILM